MKWKGTLVLTTLILILSFSVNLELNSQMEVEAFNGYPVHNLITGLNYTTIQEAIDANETLDEHVILVEEGVYYEHVILNKSLSLMGENRNITIIDGNGTGTVIIIAADNVSIIGFTIQGSNTSAMTSGIYASQWTIGSNISHNIIMDNRKGIEFDYYCSNNTVNDNIVVSNNDDGIEFKSSAFNNTVQRNTVSINNVDGIQFWTGGGSNIIENNIVHSNLHEGIRIQKGDKVIVKGNWLHNNYRGIFMEDCSNCIISNNNVTNSYGMLLLDAVNNLVSSNLALYGGYGIKIEGDSFNNNIVGNKALHNNGYGIFIGRYSFNNTVQGNTVVDNSNGISLDRADNNTLCYNNASENIVGIFIVGSGDNLVFGNTVAYNTMLGIGLISTGNNLFIRNNIVNNDQQALVSYLVNSWDDGLEGNYWSNYTGYDLNKDGIGDSPHVLDANNTDHYPLMGMFSCFNATSEHQVEAISNSSIADFNFNGTSISFNVSGEDMTSGFSRLCIPRALMNETFRVFVNGTEVAYNLLPVSNSTHSYLYFSYDHSTKEVVIIPEFPSLIILPFLMTLTLLAALVLRRRKAGKTHKP